MSKGVTRIEWDTTPLPENPKPYAHWSHLALALVHLARLGVLVAPNAVTAFLFVENVEHLLVGTRRVTRSASAAVVVVVVVVVVHGEDKELLSRLTLAVQTLLQEVDLSLEDFLRDAARIARLLLVAIGARRQGCPRRASCCRRIVAVAVAAAWQSSSLALNLGAIGVHLFLPFIVALAVHDKEARDKRRLTLDELAHCFLVTLQYRSEAARKVRVVHLA